MYSNNSNNNNPNWIDIFEEQYEQEQLQMQQLQGNQSNSIPSTQTNITSSMFTENEVKTMITNYNATLSTMIRDNDNLRQQNQIIEDQYFGQIKDIKQLSSNIQTLNIEKQHYQLLNDKLKQQYQQTLHQVDLLGLNDDDDVVVINQNQNQLTSNTMDNNKETNDSNKKIHDQIQQEISKMTNISGELKQKIQNYIQNNRQKDLQYANMKQININLQKEVSQLQNQIVEYEQEKYKIRFCISCKQNFSPLNNEENSCVYHQGKLKYYSCRGCGGDEYWTCCNQCSKCKPGCRTRKHIAYNE